MFFVHKPEIGFTSPEVLLRRGTLSLSLGEAVIDSLFNLRPRLFFNLQPWIDAGLRNSLTSKDIQHCNTRSRDGQTRQR